MKKIIYIFVALFLASCTSNTIYKKPKNLIPKDSMVTLLTDMYIAASAKYTRNKFSEKSVNYTSLVYKKYKIDSIRFEESNFYYNSRIELYNEMLREVKEELDMKKNAYEFEVEYEKFIKRIRKQLKTEKDTLSTSDSD